MDLVIKSKNYGVKGYIKEEIESRFEKLSKYFTDDSSATVTVSGEGSQKKAEITVSMRNRVLKSEVRDQDARAAIDKAIDKIEKQLVKNKEKLRTHNYDSIRYDNIADSSVQEARASLIVKNKKFKLQPMSAQEAAFQLELLEHQFFVFLNEATGSVSVVYKREDGDYGLIEAEL